MDAGGRGCNHDTAAAALHHRGNPVLQTEPYAADVDRDDTIEHVDRIIGDRLHVALDTRIGQIDVDPAVAIDRRLYVPLRVVVAGHVGSYRTDLITADRIDRVAQRALFQIDDQHLGALVNESFRRSATDTAR